MLFQSSRLLTYLALSAPFTLITAQLVGQIGDGQIQNPVAPAAPNVAPMPSAAPMPPAENMTSSPPPSLSPVNHTAPKEIPVAYPSAANHAPLNTANTTVPTFPSTSASAAILGGNATAPSVPSVPQPNGGGIGNGNGSGIGTDTGSTGTEGEAPKEAGTSAPAVASANGVERVGGGLKTGARQIGVGVLVAVGLMM